MGRNRHPKNRAGAIAGAGCSIDSDSGLEVGGAGAAADSEASYLNGGGAVPNPGAGSAGPGLEPDGLVGGAVRLEAEVEAAAAGIPGLDPATGQVQLDPALANPNGQWSALTPPTVEVLCAVVLPAWQIQPGEQRPVAEALAECLEQVFPGGIEGKYACWVRLMVACGAITVSRVATNNGKLPPLFVARAKPASSTPRDPQTITSLTE
jgi:hypothetical protein